MCHDSVDKVRELILYITSRYADDRAFGVTRLTKVLFWSDFEHFRVTGEAITGRDYVKMERGPMLEGFQGVLEGMQSRRDLRIEKDSAVNYPLNRPVAQRQPDLRFFSQDELRTINRVIEENRGKTAKQVSDESHAFLGWQVAQFGERIPYGTVWLSAPQVTEDDVEYGHELAVRLGLG